MATHMFSQTKLCYRGLCVYDSWDTSLHTQLIFALSSWHSRGHEFILSSGLPSFPLKSLVADSNNKLQSDQSIVDQLELLKSLRMRGWGKNQFAIYIRLMSVENTEKETAPRIQV